MTIVHLTAPAQFGGLERMVAGLCRETSARGHRVVLLMTLSPGDPVPAWARELDGSGVVVEVVHLPSRAYLAERRAVREVLRRHTATVVHAHGFRSDVVHAGVVRRAGLPIVSTAHGFAAVDLRGKIYEWLQLRAWRGFDAVVAVSQPLMGVLERAGVPRDRLVMIRNGYSPGVNVPLARAAARERLGLPADVPVVGWVGRFSEEKGPVRAVETLARMATRDVHLCLIGDGAQREATRARVAGLDLASRVVLTGALPDAAPLLGAFDALMLSSSTEGTPMVVLEAAAAGIPVVSTAVGGVPDLLGDDGGWLAPAGDATALAAAADAALADRGEVTRRTAVLRKRLVERGPGDWVDQYLALYARVSGAGVSGPARSSHR